MTNQIETKQIKWEDLEVAEEQVEKDSLVIDWIPGLIEDVIINWHRPQVERPIRTRCKCCIDPARPGGDFTALTKVARASAASGAVLAAGEAIAQGVILAFGISAEEFAKAMEGQARAVLESEVNFLNTPVIGAVNWREANERLPSISEMVARVNAFCTPSRLNLTGRE